MPWMVDGFFNKERNKAINDEIKRFENQSEYNKKIMINNFENQFLTDDIKSKISPPNGLVFTHSSQEISNISNKNDLREIILNEVLKFNNAISIEDRKLGYMYFIIGLSELCSDCLNSHQWVLYAIQ